MKPRTKLLLVPIYIIQALPIPLSLATWIGTIMAFASEWIWPESIVGAAVTLVLGIASLAMFVLAGLYPLTYFYSLNLTLKYKRISLHTFLPVFHIALLIKMYMLISFFSAVYGIAV